MAADLALIIATALPIRLLFSPTAMWQETLSATRRNLPSRNIVTLAIPKWSSANFCRSLNTTKPEAKRDKWCTNNEFKRIPYIVSLSSTALSRTGKEPLPSS
jgi:hypothetical protein